MVAVKVLIVDGANVVGSRPDGWWRDRPGAARRLHERLARGLATDALADEVVLVLEGQARTGVPEGADGGVRTIHAPGEGDDEIVAQAKRAVAAAGDDDQVLVVTADRALRARCTAAGAAVAGPSTVS